MANQKPIAEVRTGSIKATIWNNSVGRVDYPMADFVDDVKRACACETVAFDCDLFNERVRR